MVVGAGGTLDDRGVLGRFDQSGMLDAVGTIPVQIRDAWQRTRNLTVPERYRAARTVALLGMGGSAIGGDLVRGIFSDRLRVPLVNVRDYELPAWVDADTLVVASSYSGATEETISALSTALERKCPVAVITTGGPLKEVATKADLPLLTFAGDGRPRAAVGYSVVLLAGLLERAGMLTIDNAEVRSAVAATTVTIDHCGVDVPNERNPAKQLAWSLVDRLPVIVGSGFLAAVARRWKTQLNENAKSHAIVDELPEATHNSVVGYEQPESVRDHLYVIFLSSAQDHPRNQLRASLSAELLGGVNTSHQVVPVAGEGPLAQAFSAITLGDYTSTYLAILYGLDPTPVDAIGHIKTRMAASEAEEDE